MWQCPGRIEIGTVNWSITGLQTSSQIPLNLSWFTKTLDVLAKIQSGSCAKGLAPKADAQFTFTTTPKYCDCESGNLQHMIGPL